MEDPGTTLVHRLNPDHAPPHAPQITPEGLGDLPAAHSELRDHHRHNLPPCRTGAGVFHMGGDEDGGDIVLCGHLENEGAALAAK